MRFRKSVLIALTASLLLSGCTFVERWVYRPDINQGNYVTATETAKLQVGQTKEQVQYIMGTPMLTSVFGDNTWYYVFREQPHHGYVRQLTYTLIFNRDRLAEIKTADVGNATEQNIENSDK